MTPRDIIEAERIAGELVRAHRFLGGNLPPDRLDTHRLAKAIQIFDGRVYPALSAEDEAELTLIDSL